jgi:hypothetical protein
MNYLFLFDYKNISRMNYPIRRRIKILPGYIKNGIDIFSHRGNWYEKSLLPDIIIQILESTLLVTLLIYK